MSNRQDDHHQTGNYRRDDHWQAYDNRQDYHWQNQDNRQALHDQGYHNGREDHRDARRDREDALDQRAEAHEQAVRHSARADRRLEEAHVQRAALIDQEGDIALANAAQAWRHKEAAHQQTRAVEAGKQQKAVQQGPAASGWRAGVGFVYK